MKTKENILVEPQFSVVVRKRALANGVYSLYLDINTQGKRQRENLGLYLLPESTIEVKEQNQKTMHQAECIAIQRRGEHLGNEELQLSSTSDITFLTYYKEHIKKRFGVGSKKGNNALNTQRMLDVYCDENFMVSEISKDWINGFKTFLDNVVPYNHKVISRENRCRKENLSLITKVEYFNIFRHCILAAFKERLLPSNPFYGDDAVQGYTLKDYKRKLVYLDWDELDRLYKTPCDHESLKRAFLFSCYTGTRFFEVRDARWSDINIDEAGHLSLTVPVYKRPLFHDVLSIPKQAECFLTNNGDEDIAFNKLKYKDALIFPDMDLSARTFCYLREWAMKAEVKKDFTFYAARHTYVVMLLKSGLTPEEVADIIRFKDQRNINFYVNHLKAEENEQTTSTSSTRYDQ